MPDTPPMTGELYPIDVQPVAVEPMVISTTDSDCDSDVPIHQEHDAMLDVHVPHATHTWKDFWIHLGTIAAGLLIAIGLEQSVVAMVRLHDKHKLEASLREECQ